MSKLAQNKIIFNLTLVLIVASGVIPISGCRKIGDSIVWKHLNPLLEEHIFNRAKPLTGDNVLHKKTRKLLLKPEISSHEKFIAYELALEIADREKEFKYPYLVKRGIYNQIKEQVAPDTSSTESKSAKAAPNSKDLDRVYFCENNCSKAMAIIIESREKLGRDIPDKHSIYQKVKRPELIKAIIELVKKADTEIGDYTGIRIGNYTIIANKSKKLYFICQREIGKPL